MEQNRNERKKQIHISDTVLAVFVAWAGVVGAIGIVAPGTTSLSVYKNAIISSQITYTNSFFAFLFFIVNIYLMNKLVPEFKKSSKIEQVCAGIFSLLLSVALHFGAQLESTECVNFKDAVMYFTIVMFALYCTPIVCDLWNRAQIFSGIIKKKQIADKALANGDNNKTISFYKIWGMIFVLWIPTFMAFFPGAFVYDATDEYIEVITRQFSMHHPLIHVLALGGIVHGAEYVGLGANAGIAIYTVIQMAVFSAVIAYFVSFLQKRNVTKKYLLGTIIFFGLFPIFPMYAVCSAKDTLFTAFFLLVVLLLWDFVENSERFFDKKFLLFVIASVVMMLFRNNGMYAYAVSIPVIGICLYAKRFEKKSVIKLLVLMALSIVIYKGANTCFKIACNASDNEHQEILTVPLQQLARTYKYAPEVFSEEEKATLYEILPENYLITYTARCSDVLKSGFNNDNYEKSPQKYRKLWWNIFKKKPVIYINAWLVNSYGYWYPDMFINVYGGNQMYTYKYENSSYFGFETEPPGERHSLFPLYERFYRNISLELFQQKVPVISMLFAPGFVFVLFAGYIAGAVSERKWDLIAVFTPVFLLWCTVLLGPTVLVRYVLILWCIVPLLPLIMEQKA